MAPWTKIAEELEGPWHTTVVNTEFKFTALTSTDIKTKLAEMMHINHKTADRVCSKFEQF